MYYIYMLCRGRAALTDCHYLSKALGARHLAGYYLGCAMSDPVREAVEGIFEVIERVAARTVSTMSDAAMASSTEAEKEDKARRLRDSVHIEKVRRFLLARDMEL
jgi:hypothetical protein